VREISKHVHWIGFLLAVIGLAAHSAVIQPWTLDDAFISFRYADHFAQGMGLVYNEGGRVEGYTTFLWVLLLGVGRLLGLEIVALSKVLGTLFALGSLLLLAHAHRFLPGANRTVSAVAVTMAGASGIFTSWVMSGMEVAMAAFWVLLALLIHVRSRVVPGGALAASGGICCALATMTRPEFAILFVVLFVDRLATSIRNRDRAFLRFGLAFTLLYAPYFAWRWWYYGWLFPNTFYAKVGSSAEQIHRG